MMTQRLVIITIGCLLPWVTQAQEIFRPYGLRTDLINHTERVFKNGHLVQQTLADYLQDSLTYQAVTIKSRHPAFSWVMNDTGHRAVQKSYQIIVASDAKYIDNNIGDVWDSKVVVSNRSSGVLHKGKALQANKIYYWKVRVINNKGFQSGYSAAASFVTASNMEDYGAPSYPLQKTSERPVYVRQDGTVYLADFGKDAFAQLDLTLRDNISNDSITVEFGERLDQSGGIDTRPGGTIRYAKYRLKVQPGTFVYPVRFSADKRNTGAAAIKMPAYIGEVLPFRYVRISNYNKPVSENDIVRKMVHYYFDEQASSFHSSDSVLNKIWEFCKYTMKATSFAGIYVDGDRERIPYEADALINQLSHYAVDNDYSLARRSHEYLIEHATWPTEWILQSVLIAWNDFMYTGDTRSLEKHYVNLKAKLLLPLSRPDGLISSTGKQDKELLQSIHFRGQRIRDIVDWPVAETDGFVFSEVNSVVNAFHYRALVLMNGMANAIGNEADAQFFHNQALRVKKAFQHAMIDTVTGLVKDGESVNHSSLHANMFAVAFDLLDPERMDVVSAFIRSRGMACSVYGAQFLMDAIYETGAGDYGLSLLTDTSNRSWYNMLREGATMTMEAWGNVYKPNQDWNHAWGAVPANIIMRKVVGIESVLPGYQKMNIFPQIGTLSSVSANLPTIKGNISVDIKQGAHSILMKIHLPVNTTADVFLPAAYAGKKVFVNGRPTRAIAHGERCFISNIGSGNYDIKIL